MKTTSFDFDYIDRYFRKKDHSKALHVLSDKVCHDLDFEELFMFLDRTESRIGQQYLYERLRVFHRDEKEIEIHESVIHAFSTDAAFRARVRKRLSKLNKFEAYYLSSLFQDAKINPPKWFWIVKVLSFATALSIILLFFNPKTVVLLIGLVIANLIIHYWNKKNVIVHIGSLTQLMKLSATAQKLAEEEPLKPLNPNIKTNIRTVEKLRSSIWLFSTESLLQSDLGALAWFIYELLKITFLLEPLLLFNALKHIETKRNAIKEVFAFVGKTDMLFSVASLRETEGDYCRPTIHSAKTSLIATEMYHPLIDHCVKNSIDTRGKSILLTGSNMSGKTSFIRTIGINLITAHTLNMCFAKTFSAPFARLLSAIRISDDLMNDRSYYFEEVLTVKEMIAASETDAPIIFLLDELFKGTNTIERVAAGKSVLSYLSRRNNMVFVSTHDIELADMLKDEFDLYHFSETVDNKNINFDYLLKTGKLTRRNAIKILEINDYPFPIIEESIQISRRLDEEKLNKKNGENFG